ncbi:hypothetical protein JQ615_24830 [Bradyrhizobium jicamae]|uniref:Uncharacterized protein n=1 Tax=Bradyrhizobium jicamae TaxID=280332 RepID=A0ABS5FQI6_9BRAD|nr:hypothetical protein [Bradyrhizobium jicamae]MBR0798616.1 hypothetical protein [Bradyrhizobium jicamae]
MTYLLVIEALTPQLLAAFRPAHSARSSGMTGPQKITFGDMRSMGVRGVLIY